MIAARYRDHLEECKFLRLELKYCAEIVRLDDDAGRIDGLAQPIWERPSTTYLLPMYKMYAVRTRLPFNPKEAIASQ